ncbi:MAG: hypothetical protein ACM3MK_12395 [Chitinophagales bacterium]
MTVKLQEELNGSYGEIVTVTYIDTEKTGLEKYPLVAKAVRMGYNFPFVSINGHPRFAGGIDLKQINDVIKETMNE